MRVRAKAAAATAAMALALPAVASAETTIGTVVPPPGATAFNCHYGFVVVPKVEPSGITYTVPVPEGRGEIREWRMEASGAAAGAGVTLVVGRWDGTRFTVEGSDFARIPDSLDANGIATFRPETPIPVTGGEVIAIRADPGAPCVWKSAAVPEASTAVLEILYGPVAGQQLALLHYVHGAMANVSATVSGVQDNAVEARADASAAVGRLAALHATVTNRGPSREAIEFTDVVPDGLEIQSAAAGSGRCRIAGQTVTCWISGLAAGESAPVLINVVSAAPGTYLNRVSVAPGEGARDPDPSNDGGTVGLTVGAAPSPGGGGGGGGGSDGGGGDASPPAAAAAGSARCVVPVLRGTPLRVARELLRELGCTVGKVKRVRSRKVRRGAVIRTSPAASTRPAGATVDLRVSRGPRRRQ